MSAFDLTVRGGEVLLPEGLFRADVVVRDGRFAGVGRVAPSDGPVIDAGGCHVLPGAIDSHVHFGVTSAGFRSRDGYADGTAAAVCGGVTTVGDFTEQSPGESLAASIERRLAMAGDDSRCDWFLHANLTSITGDVFAEIPLLVEAGITSFKLFLAYPEVAVDRRAMTGVMKAVGHAGGLVMVHAEDGAAVETATNEMVARGRLAATWFFDSRPAKAEGDAVRVVGESVVETGCPAYLVHLSSSKGLEAARVARRSGAAMTLETCPQYLLLERPGVDHAHPERLTCSPPLRTLSDCSALTAALASGEIDVLATDHCPFTTGQKAAGAKDFRLAPGGLPGVETLLPIAYHMLLEGTLAPETLARSVAETPARTFGLDRSKGAIRPGLDADFVIADPSAETVVRSEDMHSDTDYSPFEGLELRGALREVYLRGRCVARRGAGGKMEPTGDPAGRFRKARPLPPGGPWPP